MRILLTGSKGQLGRCFKDRLPENWELIAADSATLDITDAEAVLNMARSFQPDAIVNAAAYTAVDRAEQESDTAFAVNGSAVHNLASAARAVHARFIHISTDYIFDGKAKTPYTESGLPNPLNVYGRSKLAGELLALSTNPNSLIIRTSWVFSEHGNNFVKTMLDAAAANRELSIADDQTGTPTYAGDLAQILIDLLNKPALPRGIYHYCGSNPVTWHGFAQNIFQAAARHNPEFKTPAIRPCADTSSNTPRPGYSVLDCHKIQTELGISQPDWHKALAQVIAKLNP
ncbi:dTDP-4-dehydrorhamnose reductase [Neisseria weaveri]|uniref:dTDP-4-dehydrorhamnose reductase n=1 Tax=Neisseria weaveri TaxID=28091 RepID=A0A3S5A878_9NEIS|nr:dTDP-4-dehydrorhamnose reductase [Neisseria weaveri]EGV35894.1 dTDP-4-dehydrorhamnose reductase [Neisseria weaveri ATCC 51223]SAY51223.1 dTDP-4-dehydrorhamnose reductase [Neisseria weaveri]VEJ49926.1 dTDP-4-dehydrorhamnose reductase [Neisseria weaveri]